jgi:hypothetical protein
VKKGALVELVAGLGAAPPNVVIFQFNPETMQHSWSQGLAATGGAAAAKTGSNAYAVSGAPSESFSFTLSMDVTDQLTDPDRTVQLDAERHGIYSRIAALELFLYPKAVVATGSRGRTTPAALLPVVLFVWGASRIVPVRMTSLTITEKLYDAELNPTHADAQLQLQVLTEDDLRSVTGAAGALARTACTYTNGERKVMAAINLGASARALVGIVVETITKLP